MFFKLFPLGDYIVKHKLGMDAYFMVASNPKGNMYAAGTALPWLYSSCGGVEVSALATRHMHTSPSSPTAECS